jgi:NAD(P)H-dependent FMN reductase
MGQYMHPHTRGMGRKDQIADAFIFVTPEYNHSIPAALKNALDFVYSEWNNKAAGLSVMVRQRSQGR